VLGVAVERDPGVVPKEVWEVKLVPFCPAGVVVLTVDAGGIPTPELEVVFQDRLGDEAGMGVVPPLTAGTIDDELGPVPATDLAPEMELVPLKDGSTTLVELMMECAVPPDADGTTLLLVFHPVKLGDPVPGGDAVLVMLSLETVLPDVAIGDLAVPEAVP
jgi:hypothetical protein